MHMETHLDRYQGTVTVFNNGSLVTIYVTPHHISSPGADENLPYQIYMKMMQEAKHLQTRLRRRLRIAP